MCYKHAYLHICLCLSSHIRTESSQECLKFISKPKSSNWLISLLFETLFSDIRSLMPIVANVFSHYFIVCVVPWIVFSPPRNSWNLRTLFAHKSPYFKRMKNKESKRKTREGKLSVTMLRTDLLNCWPISPATERHIFFRSEIRSLPFNLWNWIVNSKPTYSSQMLLLPPKFPDTKRNVCILFQHKLSNTLHVTNPWKVSMFISLEIILVSQGIIQ